MATLFAQATGASPQPAAPAATPPKVKPAWVRFWNMTPGADTYELLNAQGSGAPTAFSAASSRNFYAPYLPVAPGTYNFSVCKMGQRESVLKKLAVTLRSDVFITVLVAGEKPEAVKIDMLDDTWSREKASAGQAVLRNFLSAGESTVTVAGKSYVVPPGGTQGVSGLPLEKVQFSYEAKLPDGTTRAWNAEADFKRSPRATLLIFMDGRGQIRPRVSEDGVAPVIEAADTPASPPAAPTSPAPKTGR